MISSLPGATVQKPGVATKPLPGVSARVVRADGTDTDADEAGFLVIDAPWPGIARTLHGDHERYVSAYFSQIPGRYFAGDGAVR